MKHCYVTYLFIVMCLICLTLAEEDDEKSTEYPVDNDPISSLTPTQDDLVFSIFIIVTAVGLIANIVVIFVIFCGNEIGKTITTLYILQLTLADCAFLLVLPFFAIQQFRNSWIFGSITCKVCQTVKYLNYYAGIFFLTAMSIDRYIAVKHSTRANQLRTKTRTLISCAMVWFVSALASLPAMMYSGIEEVEGSKLCRLMLPGYQPFSLYEDVYEYSATGNLSYYYEGYYSSNETMQPPCQHENEPPAFYIIEIIKLCLGYFIPLCVISISYIRIIQQLRHSEEKVRRTSITNRLLNKRGGNRTHTMRKRVTRMVSILVLCFALCWLPYHLFELIQFQGFYVAPNICSGIRQSVVILGYSNSALNPILYTFLGHKFRDRLSESLSKTKRRLGSQGWFNFPWLVITRKSGQRTRIISKQVVGDHFSRCRRESGHIYTAGPGETPSFLTENQTRRNGTKVSLLESIKKVDPSRTQEDQSEKTDLLNKT